MTRDPSGPNPTHQAFLRDEGLRDRRESGLEFGDSTILTLGSDIEDLRRAFGPPEGVDLISVIALAADHPERLALDAHSRAILTRSEKRSNGDDYKMHIPLSPDLTAVLNTGFAGSEPAYLLLIGNQGYRVTADSSQRFLLQPENDFITVNLASADNVALLRALPALDHLRDIQVVRGEELRRELQEFADLVQERLTALMTPIREIVANAQPPHLAIDVPDAEGREVEVRFYITSDLQINSFEIAARL